MIKYLSEMGPFFTDNEAVSTSTAKIKPSSIISAQIMFSYDVEFSYIDVLEFPEVRSTLPSISDWPTFPQLFVDGELVGGCDIVTELDQNGELKNLLAN